MAELSAGTEKLVQYLNEAYGTEMRLETALQAHIAMTAKDSYRKRLRDHLTETRRHARDVKQRIKVLGGVAETTSAPGPTPVAEAAQVVVSGAQKAVALAQGPLHALRGTGEQEKQLKNAKTEFASEAEEIATYTAIEALAVSLGDKQTQQLARGIRREEERMRAFLEKEIPRLTKEVAKAEIPASERRSSGRPKKTKRAKSKAKAGRSMKAKATKAKAKAKATKVKAKATKVKAKATKAKGTATKATKTKAKATKAKATKTKTTKAKAKTKTKAKASKARR